MFNIETEEPTTDVLMLMTVLEFLEKLNDAALEQVEIRLAIIKQSRAEEII